MVNADQAKSTISQIKRKNTLDGRITVLLGGARAHSKPRGHDAPTITKQDIKDLWESQGGLCAYTGWQMDTITRSPYLVSIDRIDNAKGYELDNIVLVCWAANDARGKLSVEQFKELCHAVSATYRGESTTNEAYEATISPVIAWVCKLLCSNKAEELPITDYYPNQIRAILAAL